MGNLRFHSETRRWLLPLACCLGALTNLSTVQAVDVSCPSAHSKSEMKIARIPVKGPDSPEDQYFLEPELGTISKERYQELIRQFRPESAPNFSPAQSYKLTDFLPNFMKMSSGKILIPHSVPASPELLKLMESQGIKPSELAEVDSNCHSITWQWINHLQGRGNPEILLTLADGNHLQELLQNSPQIEMSSIEAGDVLLISGNGGWKQQGEVLHSAVYLGNGLVFEKPNPGDKFVFRISYLQDVVTKYKTVDSQSKVHFYRTKDMKEILPNLPEELSLASLRNQRTFNFAPQGFSPAILSSYILQESWDHRAERSVFNLGLLVRGSEVSPSQFFRPPQN
jgi:hypothetical protein